MKCTLTVKSTIRVMVVAILGAGIFAGVVSCKEETDSLSPNRKKSTLLAMAEIHKLVAEGNCEALYDNFTPSSVRGSISRKKFIEFCKLNHSPVKMKKLSAAIAQIRERLEFQSSQTGVILNKWNDYFLEARTTSPEAVRLVLQYEDNGWLLAELEMEGKKE